MITSIATVILLAYVIDLYRPREVFDHENNQYKPLGLGKGETIIPVWLILLLVGLLAIKF